MSSPDVIEFTGTSPRQAGVSVDRSGLSATVRPLPSRTSQAGVEHVKLIGNWIVFADMAEHFETLPGRSLATLHAELHELSVDVRDTLEGGIALDVRIAPQTVLSLIKTYELSATPRVLNALKEASRLSWQEQALCKEADPDLFFPEKGAPTTAAKRICQMCPVRQECLDYALENDERYGIWGGKSERERRKLQAARRAAAAAETAAEFAGRRVG